MNRNTATIVEMAKGRCIDWKCFSDSLKKTARTLIEPSADKGREALYLLLSIQVGWTLLQGSRRRIVQEYFKQFCREIGACGRGLQLPDTDHFGLVGRLVFDPSLSWYEFSDIESTIIADILEEYCAANKEESGEIVSQIPEERFFSPTASSKCADIRLMKAAGVTGYERFPDGFENEFGSDWADID